MTDTDSMVVPSTPNSSLECYVMPPFSGRNIIIFSDGTGQAGGLQLDEYRSNVYKLFRATRCGPDTEIDPDLQLTFYDPGLGSKSAGEDIKISFVRKLYNYISSATGLGITKNVIDCYAALIHLWRPGDRIFLFGFSRGAYTVRSLGGVLSLCGIPTINGDAALLRNKDSVRKIAREAVTRVYRHGSGTDDKGQSAKERKERLEKQRKALGRQFQTKYGAAGHAGLTEVPHFIGVWDTVAAVGVSPPVSMMLKVWALLLLLLSSLIVAWISAKEFNSDFFAYTVATFGATLLLGLIIYFGMRVKFATGLPGYKWYQTLHLISFRMAFFDRSLNARVRYARHALAIDECRADFDRTPWVNEEEPENRELEEGAWFKQVWFAGNHSDIGGSYPETESRLSDIALDWMVDQAQRAGLLVDKTYLKLFGRYTGQQHDEFKEGIHFLGRKFRWRKGVRNIKNNAPLHPSVLNRFEEASVLIYDEEVPYRPEALRNHEMVSKYYESS